MCNNPKSPYVVGLPKQGNRALVIKANCDMWECEECAKNKKSHWAARAILGLQEIQSRGTAAQFITVTTAEWYKTSVEARVAFPRAWNKLYCRLKRKNPQLMYLLTIEFGAKTGHMHAHFLTDAQQNKRWYKDNARQCGMGYEAEVLPVDAEGTAAGYVAKYIGKSLAGQQLPLKFRRVRCSQNWTPLASMEVDRLSGDYDWLVCNTHNTLWLATEECQAKDYDMILPSTGEFFDYGDAIDTWYH